MRILAFFAVWAAVIWLATQFIHANHPVMAFWLIVILLCGTSVGKS